jgi:hypothetical protein
VSHRLRKGGLCEAATLRADLDWPGRLVDRRADPCGSVRHCFVVEVGHVQCGTPEHPGDAPRFDFGERLRMARRVRGQVPSEWG